VIEANRQPGILARELGSMLQTAREVAELSFAGTADRIGVRYIPFLGTELASGELYDLWARIEDTLAAGPDQSRAILERHLASMAT
jgi:hypothetical protein